MHRNIIFRNLKIEDLDDFFKMNHLNREYHKFNGPYYKQKTLEELIAYTELLKEKFKEGDKTPLEQQTQNDETRRAFRFSKSSSIQKSTYCQWRIL